MLDLPSTSTPRLLPSAGRTAPVPASRLPHRLPHRPPRRLLSALCLILAGPGAALAGTDSWLGLTLPPMPPGCRSVEGAVLEAGHWHFTRVACADGQRLLLGRVLPGSGNPPRVQVADERRLPTPGPRPPKPAQAAATREMDYALCNVRGTEQVALAAMVWRLSTDKAGSRHLGWEGLWGFDLARGRIIDMSPEQVACEVMEADVE